MILLYRMGIGFRSLNESAMRSFVTLMLFVLVITLPFLNKFVENKKINTNNINRDYIERVVSQYIENNPDLIISSIMKYQQSSFEKDKHISSSNMIKKYSKQLYSDQYPIIGKDNATKVIVEFFDYACGYCRTITETLKQVAESHDVKIILRDLPILGDRSQKGAEAATTVFMIAPDKYYDFYDMLMAHKGSYTEDMLEKALEQLSINKEDFYKTQHSPSIQNKINDSLEIAANIGIRGVPSIIINGKIFTGAFSYNEIVKEITAGGVK